MNIHAVAIHPHVSQARLFSQLERALVNPVAEPISPPGHDHAKLFLCICKPLLFFCSSSTFTLPSYAFAAQANHLKKEQPQQENHSSSNMGMPTSNSF
jgi:hypothetical protein